jgi:hypothetical protein
MKRLLRLDNKEVILREPGFNLTCPVCGTSMLELSDKALNDLSGRIEKELEKRNEVLGGKVEIFWEGDWNGFTKRPYLAILTPPINERADKIEPPTSKVSLVPPWLHSEQFRSRLYEYNFLKLCNFPLHNGIAKFKYSGYLKIGTVLRGRVREGEEYFYRVCRSGLELISGSDARRVVLKAGYELSKRMENETESK